MQTISPCLWFNDQAEEAVNFYISVFSKRTHSASNDNNSKILTISHYGEGGPFPKGTVLALSFLLDGQEFTALNGGPLFSFSPAISFVVNCHSQDEIDYFWDRLLEGGEEQNCGWLKDKYGISWQIVPVTLFEMMSDPDKVKSQRVMNALLQMMKLDLKVLKKAFTQG
jgi:predicted 3-demethylubiquinone-9 3-methyltransferase (glyoxalase superfamily)